MHDLSRFCYAYVGKLQVVHSGSYNLTGIRATTVFLSFRYIKYFFIRHGNPLSLITSFNFFFIFFF
jgi:hypothetical protein